MTPSPIASAVSGLLALAERCERASGAVVRAAALLGVAADDVERKYCGTVAAAMRVASAAMAHDAQLREENQRLRADLKYTEHEQVGGCEACGAILLPDDDIVSDDNGVSGCWAAMTDLPSKRDRPCYAYRVGKPSAALRALAATGEQP